MGRGDVTTARAWQFVFELLYNEPLNVLLGHESTFEGLDVDRVCPYLVKMVV